MMYFVTSRAGITGPYNEGGLEKLGLNPHDANVVSEGFLTDLLQRAKVRRFLEKEHLRLWRHVGDNQELAERHDVAKIYNFIEMTLASSYEQYITAYELADLSLAIDMILEEKE